MPAEMGPSCLTILKYTRGQRQSRGDHAMSPANKNIIAETTAKLRFDDTGAGVKYD